MENQGREMMKTKSEWWMNMDGAKIRNYNRVVLEYSLRLDFEATNNMAENEALLTRLELTKAIGAEVLNVRSDSQLVIHQFAKIYEVKEPS